MGKVVRRQMRAPDWLIRPVAPVKAKAEAASALDPTASQLEQPVRAPSGSASPLTMQTGQGQAVGTASHQAAATPQQVQPAENLQQALAPEVDTSPQALFPQVVQLVHGAAVRAPVQGTSNDQLALAPQHKELAQQLRELCEEAPGSQGAASDEAASGAQGGRPGQMAQPAGQGLLPVRDTSEESEEELRHRLTQVPPYCHILTQGASFHATDVLSSRWLLHK